MHPPPPLEKEKEKESNKTLRKCPIVNAIISKAQQNAIWFTQKYHLKFALFLTYEKLCIPIYIKKGARDA